MKWPFEIETEYKGLAIRAPSNLHQECYKLIDRIGLPQSAKVLDLGSGEGAFTKRLIDKGFDVRAVEIEAGRFQADALCYHWDLNREFSLLCEEKFDLVLAIEVIEHLHDPRRFLKGCLSVLKPNGWVIITSPNVESWVSRIKFLRTGRFLWFDEVHYETLGHITPIFSWQLPKSAMSLRPILSR